MGVTTDLDIYWLSGTAVLLDEPRARWAAERPLGV
jgi:hypothetical protein